jgi:hypothetical protein
MQLPVLPVSRTEALYEIDSRHHCDRGGDNGDVSE